MKKIFIILLSFFIVFLFSGCDRIPVTFDKKPSNSYYSEQIVNKFNSVGIDNVSAFEINYSKEISVNESDNQIINKFLTALDKNSYIKQPSDLPEKAAYKLFITFKNGEKYVIDIFNDKYVAVYPWDGNYPPDYIDMTNVYTLYNLNGLCKYLFPKL